jgi:hypothetical protein
VLLENGTLSGTLTRKYREQSLEQIALYQVRFLLSEIRDFNARSDAGFPVKRDTPLAGRPGCRRGLKRFVAGRDWCSKLSSKWLAEIRRYGPPDFPGFPPADRHCEP